MNQLVDITFMLRRGISENEKERSFVLRRSSRDPKPDDTQIPISVYKFRINYDPLNWCQQKADCLIELNPVSNLQNTSLTTTMLASAEFMFLIKVDNSWNNVGVVIKDDYCQEARGPVALGKAYSGTVPSAGQIWFQVTGKGGPLTVFNGRVRKSESGA